MTERSLDRNMQEMESEHKALHEAHPPRKEGKRFKSIEETLSRAFNSPSALIAKFIGNELSDGEISFIKGQISNFARNCTILVSVLDKLAAVHPFIALAVSVFKGVINMELTRRENDDRVRTLMLTMCDMMQVLTLLRRIADPDALANHHNMSLAGYLKQQLNRIIDTMKKCARVCEKYLNQNKYVKFFKSPVWSAEFAELVQSFVEHKQELHEGLTMYISNITFDIAGSIKELDQRFTEFVNTIFGLIRPSGEREIQGLVLRVGGRDAVLKDDTLLEFILTTDARRNERHVKGLSGDSSEQDDETLTVTEFHQAMSMDIKKMLEDNQSMFEEKFEEMRRLQYNDFVHYLSSGPHERIQDEDMRTVWKGMDWKESVKAKHLVIALHDHFANRNQALAQDAMRQGEPRTSTDIQSPGHHPIKTDQDDSNTDHNPTREKVEHGEYSTVTDEHNSKVVNRTTQAKETRIADITRYVGAEIIDDDDWTLQYMTVLRVRPLVEALDDDLSSFVTISELNAFTSARPLDWSLPHWIAYWTYGFEMTVHWYFRRIRKSFAEFLPAMHQALPDNRRTISEFASSLEIQFVENILSGLCDVKEWDKTSFDTSATFLRFKLYVTKNEDRMEQNLRVVWRNYCIDNATTFMLVTGQGRPEKYLMPVLFVLMRRSLEIVQQARTTKLDQAVFKPIIISLRVIKGVLRDRIHTLRAVHKLQNLNEKEQLERYCYGLLSYALREPEKNEFWTRSPDHDASTIVEETFTRNSGQADVMSPESSSQVDGSPDLQVPDQPSEATSTTNADSAGSSADSDAPSDLIGQWNASYYLRKPIGDTQGVMVFTITSHKEDGTVRGYGVDTQFGPVRVTGELKKSKKTVLVLHFCYRKPRSDTNKGILREEGISVIPYPLANANEFKQLKYTNVVGYDMDESGGPSGTNIRQLEGAPSYEWDELPGYYLDEKQGSSRKESVQGFMNMSRDSRDENESAASEQQRLRYVNLFKLQLPSGAFEAEEDILDWVKLISGIRPKDLRSWSHDVAAYASREIYHPAKCSGCALNPLITTRLVCLDCSDDAVNDTVNICWTCLLQLRMPLWRQYLHPIFSDATLAISLVQKKMELSDGGLRCAGCSLFVSSPPYFCFLGVDKDVVNKVVCLDCACRIEKERPWMSENQASKWEPFHWRRVLIFVPGAQQAPATAADPPLPPGGEASTGFAQQFVGMPFFVFSVLVILLASLVAM